jgi:protein-tyrosine phosphatase
VSASPCIARLFPVTAERLAEDAFEIRWKENIRGFGLSVFHGDSPGSIPVHPPLAQVTEGRSVRLTGLSSDRPHFFRLVASDGGSLLVGERRPLVEGCPNLRDLGGYRTTDGLHVKWGQVFRSSNLGRLTDKGLGRLKRLGIKTVCDFRTEAEALKLPNRFPDSTAVAYVKMPIQHGEFEPTSVFDRIRNGDYHWISEEFMIQGYLESLECYPDVWARLFKRLADPRHRPLLFHCTGGKDRTGAAAALILFALGVPAETVVSDYGLSDGYNADVRQAIYQHLQPFGVDVAKVEPYFTAPESRIRALIKHIDTRYGSAVGYLVKRAGVGEKTIASLKDDLLE